MKSALRIIRLAALVLFGAFLGWGFLTPGLVTQMYQYDHGLGETARCAIDATLIGAFIGLGVEAFLRRPKGTGGG